MFPLDAVVTAAGLAGRRVPDEAARIEFRDVAIVARDEGVHGQAPGRGRGGRWAAGVTGASLGAEVALIPERTTVMTKPTMSVPSTPVAQRTTVAERWSEV